MSWLLFSCPGLDEVLPLCSWGGMSLSLGKTVGWTPLFLENQHWVHLENHLILQVQPVNQSHFFPLEPTLGDIGGIDGLPLHHSFLHDISSLFLHLFLFLVKIKQIVISNLVLGIYASRA